MYQRQTKEKMDSIKMGKIGKISMDKKSNKITEAGLDLNFLPSDSVLCFYGFNAY